MAGFVGAMFSERRQGAQPTRTKYAMGSYVQVRLSEADYLRPGSLTLVAEMRAMADGRVFLGVSVRPDPSGAPILEWSNIGDPSRWVLPGLDVDRGGAWPDVTPRADVDPGSVDGRRRSAAWVAGDRHRIQRGAAIGEAWDASDWAAAAAEYWRLRSDASRVTEDELNTILAALRFYQAAGMGEPENRPDWLHDIASPDGSGTTTSLDAEGIDGLCERLNTGEVRL